MSEIPEVQAPKEPVTVKHEVELTEEQLQEIVKRIKTELLKQAGRNNRTTMNLPKPPEKT